MPSRHLVFAIAVAIAFSPLASGTAAAQKPEQAVKKAPAKAAPEAKSDAPSAWAVTCSDRGQTAFKCEMTQTLIDEKTRAPILVLSVRREGEGFALVLRVPHGVYLPGGVTMRIDQGEKNKIALQRSDAGGVYTAVALDDKTIASLRTSQVLNLELETMPGKPADFPARLVGFGPALDRLLSAK